MSAVHDLAVQAAEGLGSEAYPVKLDVLCAVAASGAEREAAMLAALLDAAESFACDVPGMVDSAVTTSKASRPKARTRRPRRRAPERRPEARDARAGAAAAFAASTN